MARDKKIPACKIGERDADAHRPLAGQAGDRHQPAHALRDLIDARPCGVRAALPEAGDAAIDNTRIDGGDGVVVHL
jgi:hypothetical protein